MTRSASNWLVWICGCAIALATSHARADIAPINACTAPGQPCGQDGSCTCQVKTCSKSIPCSGCGGSFSCAAGHGGRSGSDDGGADDAGPVSGLCIAHYTCNLCFSDTGASCPTGAGGKGGRGGAGGHGGGGAGGFEYKDASTLGDDVGADEDKGCACSTRGTPSASGSLLAIGVLAWLMRRRR